MRDPNFYRSVVLLVKHDDKGAFGVIVNKPLEITIQAAWKQLSQQPCHTDGPLYHGGPCDGPLMALHTDKALSELQIVPGVEFSAARDAIERLLGADSAAPVRLIVGYAGWAAGQLESELAQGAWLVASATREGVFAEPETAWLGLVRHVGKRNIARFLDPQRIPDDPSVN